MTSEESNAKKEDDASQIRAEALQKFWMTCMDRIVEGGASEREASMQMLVVAGGYVSRACGAEGAVQLLMDAVGFYAQVAKAHDEAAAEAANAPHH